MEINRAAVHRITAWWPPDDVCVSGKATSARMSSPFDLLQLLLGRDRLSPEPRLFVADITKNSESIFPPLDEKINKSYD